jgi:acetyl esterase
MTMHFEHILAAIEAAPAQDESQGYDTARLIQIDERLAGVDVADVNISAPAGSIVVRQYLPTAIPSKQSLVWAHGGAWVGGSIDMPEAHWVGLALASRGIAVFSVDYHRSLHGVTYPVPSDDVQAAYEWVVNSRAAEVIGNIPVHLGGASAGGNIAAGVAKRLAERAAPPASLVLAYPALHAELPSPSESLVEALARSAAAEEDLPGLFQFTMRHYAGKSGVDDPFAVPGIGDVAASHPPTFILNADADPLRASGELYAAKLRDAGVDIRLEYPDGSRHGFLNEPESDFARHGIACMADWLLR